MIDGLVSMMPGTGGCVKNVFCIRAILYVIFASLVSLLFGQNNNIVSQNVSLVCLCYMQSGILNSQNIKRNAIMTYSCLCASLSKIYV